MSDPQATTVDAGTTTTPAPSTLEAAPNQPSASTTPVLRLAPAAVEAELERQRAATTTQGAATPSTPDAETAHTTQGGTPTQQLVDRAFRQVAARAELTNEQAEAAIQAAMRAIRAISGTDPAPPTETGAGGTPEAAEERTEAPPVNPDELRTLREQVAALQAQFENNAAAALQQRVERALRVSGVAGTSPEQRARASRLLSSLTIAALPDGSAVADEGIDDAIRQVAVEYPFLFRDGTGGSGASMPAQVTADQAADVARVKQGAAEILKAVG